MQAQIRWAGHLVRMPDHRLPKILFYGEIQQGRRSQGGQKKRFKDSLKTSLKAFDINTDTWEAAAQDRIAWRSSLRKGAAACEASKKAAAEQRRQTRKDRDMKPAPVGDIPCPHCPRLFLARIGLISHLRTHKVT